ncbi:MAG TPA: S53 family peptidase [Candidatus Baltobacteraceae bacterium]|nr:S53 family peptidase [Candidatus Baltobacteraceae bacterium]
MGNVTMDQVPGRSCAGVPGCYGPSDLQAAYGLTKASARSGNGKTVAIVDVGAYPTAAKDLTKYRSHFKLKPCTTASGCFSIVNENGATSPLPKKNEGWDQEMALDVDMVSAICPNCKIVLIEANSNGIGDIVAAEVAAEHLGNVVSNSFAAPEQLSTYPVFDDHPGVVVVAAAGDFGYAPAQPCSFAGVVCVGGTALNIRNGKRISEIAWSGSGSGCSALVPKPSWQKRVKSVSGCKMRNEADIAADASPPTGVTIVLNSNLMPLIGGTSVATPIVGAAYALVKNTGTATPATLWAHGGTSAFHDITSGTNGTCPSAYGYICNARRGYDGITGWGTLNGLRAL